MKTKPDLSFWKLWNLSFGFFGVQIAYALQSSQVSRIFSTIGADPHDLSFFWILPPLMGMIVQPIVGSASDHTWNRFGRRLPYLILGAAVAIIVMSLLPNAGSLGLGLSPTWFFGFSSAIIFGLVMLMLLDTSINMAMQPFKMLVGDMVNEKQKGLAYSIQSFLCNAGSVVGYLLPFVLAMFLSKTASDGEVPPTVTVAFYIGAAILLLCVFYSFAKIKEWPPAVYNEYNGVGETTEKSEKSEGMLKLLAKAPSVFWTVGVVQFFCWAAFLYMWSYSTDAIAGHAFNAPTVQSISSMSVNGQEFPLSKTYLFKGQMPVIEKGKFALGGISVDGSFSSPKEVIVENDTIIKDGAIYEKDGIAKVTLTDKPVALAPQGKIIKVDGKDVTVNDKAEVMSAFAVVEPGTTLTFAELMSKDRATGQYVLSETQDIPVNDTAEITLEYNTILNAASKEYQEAGDWNGVLLAVQGVIAVLWAMVLPRFRRRKVAYSLSLLIGAIGFLSIFIFTNKWMLCVSYGLAGVAWAAMLAMPFTLLTNALRGNNIGTYLGLFNCTICLPQIVAALVGGAILSLFPVAASGAAQTVNMLYVSGLLLVLGALAVWVIKDTADTAK